MPLFSLPGARFASRQGRGNDSPKPSSLSLPCLPFVNPKMFFVSPVRLSVRNLARHVTDGKLKALACAASKGGLEAGRSTSQDVRRYLEAQVHE